MVLKKGRRYKTASLVEAQFEPGSRRQVLKNLLGIKSKREMDRIEAQALKAAVDRLLNKYDLDHRFTARDIGYMHKVWLGKIYSWAGNYRKLILTKGNFTFAAPDQIPRLMKEFEEGPLHTHTPCHFERRDQVVKALAGVHAELILIHPFREGNGRVARILATLMAVQAGLPLLDFTPLSGSLKEKYVRAIHSGMDRDYRPMEEIFSQILERTLSGQKR
jgi:cell filamentation protein